MSRHLVAAGQLLDEEPESALAHALAARRLASRIAPVREAVGLAAYRAGEWQTAVSELRAYHRMTGRQTHLAVLADCERALGRPERAIDIYRGADRDALGPETAIELLMVAAGARGDLGQPAAAVAMLQVRELAADAKQPWTGRLRYAYADALLSAGRKDEAREWFARAAEADEDGATDAVERLLELDGVVLTGDDIEPTDAEGADADADEAAVVVTDSGPTEPEQADDGDDSVGRPQATGPAEQQQQPAAAEVAAAEVADPVEQRDEDGTR
ncbi:tetratricopeptide repeat protein [Micromonospora sp. NBC_01813]|uniref:tetratricopeptide repeat protein n=1 Tax=Micromonospora sp. NBC_01813 TaxID=2975988 RepID=UPI002DDAE8F2|nr:tetratricopeptide repeat protein [Micromonospora sp. NBC_01813]WSA12555.1 tetratricopeptide repeat protein [Micromonospora sp. NBC_01813]